MPTFGVFLAPDPSRDPVGLARHAEALGFDQVSISDHLTGRRPTVEPWTALTWIAAATERIRVCPNVLGLPYRPPGVVAKMTETLDRLSGGRAVLGLGAGGNDAEFRALGLDVRRPAEKVDALEEALRVIRALWTEEEVSFQGRHFTVRGARLLPRPERPIPIWLGVYGDRMIEVLGRLGDGWLPSTFFLGIAKAADRLARVRRAAEAAGRDPDELAYALNVWVKVEEGAEPRDGQVAGSPERVAEGLAGLLGQGFTHLNVSPSGDAAEQLERLAKEVLPELR